MLGRHDERDLGLDGGASTGSSLTLRNSPRSTSLNEGPPCGPARLHPPPNGVAARGMEATPICPVRSATMAGVEQRTSIDVAAAPDRVWDVLVDVERWPEWTGSVSSVLPQDGGPLAVGSRVEVSQPRIPTGTYTVTALHPGRAFTWEQHRPGSTVSAHHECTPLPDGGTRVELRVVMTGLLGSVVGRLYRKLTERYLAMEAAGLRARAEGAAG
jgi:hypothetical protein